MRAFVTGATGFLGTNLVQALDRANWDILALHRPSSDISELQKIKRVHLVPGDILDPASLRAGIPENCDAVFHVAGSAAPLPHHLEKTRFEINDTGTRNVVEACLQKKVGRLVYTSTIITYDFRRAKPLNENAPPNDWLQEPYGRSKRLADLQVENGIARGLDAVFLHPSVMFGAFDKATWSKLFLEVARGLPTPFVPPGGASVCHAKNVAEAHVAAFHRGKNNRHYILGGPDCPFQTIISEVSRILGHPRRFRRLPAPVFRAYGWAEFLTSSLIGREPAVTPHTIDLMAEAIYSDSSRAIQELGYQPATLQEALMDCYHWLVQAGMLKNS